MSRALVLIVAAVALLCSACDRHVRVTKEMQWECLPDERDLNYPEAEPVIFRYAEDPQFFDVASGRGLCQQLQASGRSTAKVTYDAWGSSRGLHGYRIESINGKPLQNIGGPARSGYHGRGNAGPHPLTKELQ